MNFFKSCEPIFPQPINPTFNIGIVTFFIIYFISIGGKIDVDGYSFF